MNKIYFKRNLLNYHNYFYQINFINQYHQNFYFQKYYNQFINFYKSFNILNKIDFNKNRESKFKKGENLSIKINSYQKEEGRNSSLDTDISDINSINSFSDEIKEEKNSEKHESQTIFENNQKNKNIASEKNKKCKINPNFENIEVLRVKVKLGNDNIAVFKLKRYDDLFETIKLFCEINLVDEKLIKPIIIESLCTLNTIYQIMNSKLDDYQISILQKIKSF